MTRRRLRACLLSTTVGALASFTATGVVQAQSASASSSAAAPSTQLGEVVVTAQKRAEKQQDVPLAVTALNAQDLVSKNEVSLNDYFHSVPGLTLYDNGEGFKQLVIRGITTGNGNTPTVGVYIDDTPIGSSTAAARGDVLVPDLDPSDLSRIEVLKGPQGTLYGASNMGGLLKYVTTPPDTRNYSGRIEVDGSTVEHGGDGYGVRAAVNIPLIQDQLALRVSGSTREDPGYIDDPSGNIHDINRAYVSNGRVALLWTPNQILTVKLNALFQERLADGSGREDYNFTTHTLIDGDLEQDRVPGTQYDHEHQKIYNATVDLNLGWGTLTSSTSYAQNKYTSLSDLTSLFGPVFQPAFGIPDYGVSLTQRFQTNKFTQEFRLAGTMDNIDWLAGAFYTRENSHFYQNFNSVHTEDGTPFDGLPPLGDSIGISHYNEVALFGDVTYHFTSKFSFQAGLRYSYNYQDSIQFSDAGLLGDASYGSGKSNEGVPTFVVAPEYKLTPDTTIYARIASGYRAGGPNFTLAGVQTPYGSDSTVNYETGAKSYFLDRKAYVELDGFYILWSNIQLLGINSLDEEFFKNAGGAFSRGFEFSGQYQPIDGLTLASNLTYTDARLTDDAPSGIYGLKGDRLPYSANFAGQVSADYVHPLIGPWNGTIGGDISYLGDRWSDYQPSADIPRIKLPAYSLVNLRAGVEQGQYSLTIFAKNVFDRRGFNAANAMTLDKIGDYSVAVVQPRTVGFSVAAKF